MRLRWPRGAEARAKPPFGPLLRGPIIAPCGAPALAVTANALRHQIDGYHAAGFAKPFRKDTLAQALLQALAMRHEAAAVQGG